MSRPKTLLITSTRPGLGSVGEIFLDNLCKQFSPGELFCIAAVSNYDVPVADPELDWMPMHTKDLPPEYHWQYENESAEHKASRQTRHIEMLTESLQPHITKILNSIKEKGIEVLWWVLNSPSLVLIADAVMAQVDLPAVGLVWDPIKSTTDQQNMDAGSQAKLELAFDRVIGKLKACGVASKGMQEHIVARRNFPTRVLINTPQPVQAAITSAPDKASATSPKPLAIALAGSMYAGQEFQGLLRALNKLNWRLDDRKVEVRVYTTYFNVPVAAAGRSINIVLRGYLKEKELVEELATADLAYLPYWFDEKYKDAVRMCFPNKLATYVAAGCPVLYHGPEESTPAEFLKTYRVGTSVHNSEPKNFHEAIRYLVSDPGFRSSFQTERDRVLKEELHPDIFKQRFFELIDIAIKDKKKNVAEAGVSANA